MESICRLTHPDDMLETRSKLAVKEQDLCRWFFRRA